LGAELFVESLLQGRKLAVLGLRFDGLDIAALDRGGEGAAGQARPAVDQHRAGAALAAVAALLGAGELELLAHASNITMQFGAKPLFENVSVKFGDGNRYGLIGANGAGKSTFMKILAGVLEPSAGNVALDPASAWPSCARTSSATKTCGCSTW
jgi:ABC-type glutathione transport system ATPase component